MNQSYGVVRFGKEDINFKVFFAKRKTLEIAVHPDKKVVVKAPIGTNFSAVREKVQRRGAWINRQLDYFRQFEPRTPGRHYVGGETHLYMGRQYRIKINDGDLNQVRLIGGFFHISVNGKKTVGRVKNLLDEWYKRKAATIFQEGLTRCWHRFQRLSGDRPRVCVRRMSKRWGSLSEKGRLTLNLNMVQAPRECIEYIITHELCHIRHSDHGSGFYRLLENVMPDWKRRKAKLEAALV